jgi:predicted amidophosphoribosyltransferase
MWVKLATMNFIGMAAFWLQSMESAVKELSWKDLCAAVTTRFEKDQYNQLVRQFFHIKQHTGVSEYIEQFDELVHQLKAHDPSFNASLITNKFVDGLRAGIKAVVMIHKPINLDSASSLALLQEELTVDVSKRDFRRNDGNTFFKTPPRAQTSAHASAQRSVFWEPRRKAACGISQITQT